MFQRKIGEIFKDLHNVFGIVANILVVGYDRDGKDHNNTLQRVLHRCRQVSLKLNKDKCHFRCTQVLFFGEIISRNGVKPGPQKLKAMTEIPPQRKQKGATMMSYMVYIKVTIEHHVYRIAIFDQAFFFIKLYKCASSPFPFLCHTK